jgi:hypothetical protein
MTIARWWCKNCKKEIYVEGFEKPKCGCSLLEEDVQLDWIDTKPTKRVWDKIKASGSPLRRKKVTKRDVWRFTANLYTTEEESEQDILDKLPF